MTDPGDPVDRAQAVFDQLKEILDRLERDRIARDVHWHVAVRDAEPAEAARLRAEQDAVRAAEFTQALAMAQAITGRTPQSDRAVDNPYPQRP